MVIIQIKDLFEGEERGEGDRAGLQGKERGKWGIQRHKSHK